MGGKGGVVPAAVLCVQNQGKVIFTRFHGDDLGVGSGFLYGIFRFDNIRKAVARNENTSAEALIILAKDEKSHIRTLVAGNANTSPEVLSKLAENEDIDVRVAVAENPRTPYNTLIMLTKDKNVLISETAEEALKDRKEKSKTSMER